MSLVPRLPTDRAPPERGCALVPALRRAIQAIERRGTALEDAAPLPFGVEAVDSALHGGLTTGALHEVAAASETEIAAATGFVLGLVGRQAQTATVLWIAEEMATAESGRPYGLGLDAIGLAPERLIAVTAAHPRDTLWAMEEALRCRAVDAVVGELRMERGLDDVTARRLSLAAAAGGGLAFLLLAQPPRRASPAMTRWIVGAASSVPVRHGIGPACIGVQLVRNRHGRLGSWTLEWNCVERRFRLASTHPQPLAAAAADRPPAAAVA